MKKLYVDEIFKHGDKSSPGPAKYEHQRYFGKRGTNYSIAKKLYQDDLALTKSSRLPGPGQYVAPNLTGTSLNHSMMRTTQNFSIGKETRFHIPTKKEVKAAPDSYHPLNSLN